MFKPFWWNDFKAQLPQLFHGFREIFPDDRLHLSFSVPLPSALNVAFPTFYRFSTKLADYQFNYVF